MYPSRKKILIIGCGITGPVVALFLQRAGIEVEIYEARTTPMDNEGLFLNLACNGLEVLKPLQLDGSVSQAGSPVLRNCLWSGKGKLLGEVQIGARAEVGTPSVLITRGRLQQVLREEAVNQGIKITFGKKLQSLESDEQGVRATFEDGTTARGTCLLGCDGVHSRVRQFINASAPTPSYTGMISVGGYAQHSSFPPTPNTQHFIFGKRAFFGYHIGARGEAYWFANVSQPAAPAREEFGRIMSEEWQERMLVLFREDLPRVSELIRATDSPIIGYPIYDIPTQPIWQKGPVVLVGDAIHAISPSAGQGASLAMEDAIVLARCLRDISELSQAFATYEHLRRARVERMVQYARSLGQGKVVSNPIQVWLRDLLTPFFLKRFANPAALDWGYSYKVDWDEPVKTFSTTRK